MTLPLTLFLGGQDVLSDTRIVTASVFQKVLEHRRGTILHAIMCCSVLNKHKKKNYTSLNVCFYFPIKTYR